MDLVGQCFGNLTVVKRYRVSETVQDTTPPDWVLWECRCVCGAKNWATGSQLAQKHVTRCGQSWLAHYKAYLPGRTFGEWTVLEWVAGDAKKGRSWRCRCSCGTLHMRTARDLTSGSSTRCRECLLASRPGHSYTKTYKVWTGMLERCTNPTASGAQYYYGRGIKVCERWRDYKNFLADMGERPEGLSIDRIDNNGDYEPGNCRWADNKTQANNKSNSLWVILDGVRKTLGQLADEHGLKYYVVRERYYRGERGASLVAPWSPPPPRPPKTPWVGPNLNGQVIHGWTVLGWERTETSAGWLCRCEKGHSRLHSAWSLENAPGCRTCTQAEQTARTAQRKAERDAYWVNYRAEKKARETAERAARPKTRPKPRLYVELDGITKPLREWCKERGVNYGLVGRRWRYGKRGEELFAPVRPKSDPQTGASLNNPSYGH